MGLMRRISRRKLTLPLWEADDRILTGGFKIGGVDDHPIVHGASDVLPPIGLQFMHLLLTWCWSRAMGCMLP
jgi:hypothetical protein